MKRTARFALGSMVLATMALGIPSPAFAEPGSIDHDDIESIVDKTVGGQLTDGHIPGAIVTVVADGKTALAKGYGKADLTADTPMDAESTTFPTASEAKLYTAAAVLQLAEADKLDLDADVNDYLETFAIADTYPGKPVTVENLLTFTSGFDYDIYGWARWDPDSMPSLARFAEREQPDRIREPGEYVAYNNYDYVLAGYLVEVVSGVPFGEYLDKEVFEPLGMTDTAAGFPRPEAVTEKLATGYRPDGDSQTATAGWESPATPTGGSTVTSSSDMAAFMLAQLSADPALGDGVAELMREQRFTSDDKTPGMGYGFEHRVHNGTELLFKDGDLPGVHHSLALLPEHDLGIHVVYNGDGVDGAAFWDGREVVNRIIDEVAPGEPREPKNRGGDVSEYEGQYEPTRTARGNFARVTTLTAPVTVTASGDGELTTTGLSENPERYTQRWVHIGDGRFAELDGDHTIAFDEDGALISSEVPVTAYQRLGGLDSPTLHLIVLATTVLVLLAGLVWFPVLALIRRIRGRQRHSVGARLARILAWVISLGVVMFATGFAIVSADPNLLMQRPLTGDLTLSIALNSNTVVAALAIALIPAAVLAWVRGWWTRKGRISYTGFAVATVGFLWVTIVYHLIGFPFTLTV